MSKIKLNGNFATIRTDAGYILFCDMTDVLILDADYPNTTDFFEALFEHSVVDLTNDAFDSASVDYAGAEDDELRDFLVSWAYSKLHE